MTTTRNKMVNEQSASRVISCRYHPEAVLIDDYRAGDQICSECGFVVGDRVIDVSCEWRTFSNSDNPTASDPCRVGAACYSFIDEPNLSTIIRPVRARNAPSGGGNFTSFSNKPTMTRYEKSTANAIDLIRDMADRLNAPRVIVDRANNIFKQVHNSKQLRGRNHNATATACLYISCRQEHAPRSFKEVCAASNVCKKETGRCFKLILNALETSLDLTQIEDFASRFCSKLGLTIAVQRAASHIGRKAIELDIVAGKSPVSVISAAIYMVSQLSGQNGGMKPTQQGIADVTGVNVETIRRTYRVMRPVAVELFPDNFHFASPIECLP